MREILSDNTDTTPVLNKSKIWNPKFQIGDQIDGGIA